MKARYYQMNLAKILQQRNLSIIFGLGMLVTNILLGVLVATNNNKTILLPPQLKQSVWLQGNKVANQYLEEMALWFSHLMLDKNNNNQRFQHNLLLDYVSPQYHARLVSKVLADEKRYQDEGLSTSFYPKNTKTNQARHTVLINGDLVSRVGSKDVVTTSINVMVKFSYLQGKWYLKEFDFQNVK